MRLSLASIRDEKDLWEKAGVKLPRFDVEGVRAETSRRPEWVHFGAGNIFRGFVVSLNQRLLESGAAQTGIIACETFDGEIIDRIYAPFDNLTLNVLLNPDGSTTKEVLASIACGMKADLGDPAARTRLAAIFRSLSLQMVSFTITEKGYQLHRPDGSLLPVVEQDLADGPDRCRHAMSIVAAMLLERYRAGRLPIAVVSMDNCSRNGEKLRNAVLAVARGWTENGKVPPGFLDYLADETAVAFPWSMIDKITPRPHPRVLAMLQADGIEGMEPIVTDKKTFIAPYVNAEKPQYLVVEDRFPNGRPALERAGVYMTDRETVNLTEKMKVTTCLNPLHTAMSMFGCLLGYTLICEEMNDADIVALVKRLGYDEGLPVVVDPKILSPRAFIDEVVGERLPNVFMPDDPRRIATDTSQKVGIRFGETVKSYLREGRDLGALVALPLAIAGWFRYLLGVGDDGKPIEISPDPLKEELRAALRDVVWDDPASYAGQLRPLLANAAIFGSDLAQTPLAERIETLFVQMLAGAGAVRRTLHGQMTA
ncbi:MAG: mannitol dehydrogenase family protein [Kiritimatiellia bacterium]